MTFTNPIGLAAAARQVTGGDGAVHNYGTEIWDWICYLGCNGKPFRTKLIPPHIAREFHLADKTAQLYVRAFIAYCLASPDEFSGPGSRLVRITRGLYQLKDNPER